MSYATLGRDFEYLESICELDDQVSILDECQNFMRTPTKDFAAGLYRSSIVLWFQEARRDYRELPPKALRLRAKYYP